MSDQCGRPVEFTVKDEHEDTREVCRDHRQWALANLVWAGGRHITTKPQDAVTSGCQAPKDAPKA